ncbi:unnamed protein product [Arabidopsis halleri]
MILAMTSGEGYSVDGLCSYSSKEQTCSHPSPRCHSFFPSGTFLVTNPVTHGSTSLHTNVSPQLVCAYTFSAIKNTMLDSTLTAWKGKEENTIAAKEAFSRICSLCSDITTGKHDPRLRMS